MFFNTLEYLVFFILTFLVYWMVTPERYKKHILIVFGFLFYFIAGQFIRVFVFGLDIIVFWIGKLLFKYKEGTKKRKIAFIIGLVSIVGSLVFFKYTNMLIDIMESVSGHELMALNIVMPIGISFFTFEFIHYLTDIYFGKIKPHSFKDFLLFSFFYPTLVSGPIKRFQIFIESFEKLTMQSFFQGLVIVILGYFYKFVIADSLVPLTEILSHPQNGDTYTIGLSLYAYNFRLFFDFAGYSLIAIGSALLLGWKVPQNFNKPFISSNPSEFWRRWHMSLSSWIRDYIYIFLGGSRRGIVRTVFNLMFIMAIFGLWHGAGLNFLVWGIYHGIALAVYHVFFKKLKLSNPAFFVLGLLFTFNYVVFGWVFFATNSLTDSFTAIGKLFYLT